MLKLGLHERWKDVVRRLDVSASGRNNKIFFLLLYFVISCCDVYPSNEHNIVKAYAPVLPDR